MRQTLSPSVEALHASDPFPERHIGPREEDVRAMLETLGLASLEELIDRTVPASIRMREPLRLEPPVTERGVLDHLQDLADRNRRFRSFLGLGYSTTITPDDFN